MTTSFDALATVSATTRRPPADRESAPATHLESLSVVALMPVSYSTVQRLGMEGQAEHLHATFVPYQTHDDDSVETTGVPDIRNGDELVIAGETYDVIDKRLWPATNSTSAFLALTAAERRP